MRAHLSERLQSVVIAPVNILEGCTRTCFLGFLIEEVEKGDSYKKSPLIYPENLIPG